MPFPPQDRDPRTGLPWAQPTVINGQVIRIPESSHLTDGTPITQANISYRSALNGEPDTNDCNIELDATKAAACPPGWVELPDYSESWSRKRQEITRTFQGPWTGRQAFIQWALGYSNNFPQQGPLYGLTRVPPVQHPESPWLYAVDVRPVKGEGAFYQNPRVNDGQGNSINMIAFTNAQDGNDRLSCKLQVIYGSLDFEVRPDADLATIGGPYELFRYVTRPKMMTLKSLPLPGWLFTFTAGPFTGKPVPSSSVNLMVPYWELTYVWHEVPDIPYKAITACQGCLNMNPFDQPYQFTDIVLGSTIVGELTEANGFMSPPVGAGYQTGGYPPNSLLMFPPSITEYRGTNGRWVHDIACKFGYLPNISPELQANGLPYTGWNNLPGPDGNYYPMIATTPATLPSGEPIPPRPLYNSADYNQLFTQPNPPINYH